MFYQSHDCELIDYDADGWVQISWVLTRTWSEDGDTVHVTATVETEHERGELLRLRCIMIDKTAASTRRRLAADEYADLCSDAESDVRALCEAERERAAEQEGAAC
jgi:hypothetical protein